jgi:hypothetical protein
LCSDPGLALMVRQRQKLKKDERTTWGKKKDEISKEAEIYLVLTEGDLMGKGGGGVLANIMVYPKKGRNIKGEDRSLRGTCSYPTKKSFSDYT